MPVIKLLSKRVHSREGDLVTSRRGIQLVEDPAQNTRSIEQGDCARHAGRLFLGGGNETSLRNVLIINVRGVFSADVGFRNQNRKSRQRGSESM